MQILRPSSHARRAHQRRNILEVGGIVAVLLLIFLGIAWVSTNFVAPALFGTPTAAASKHTPAWKDPIVRPTKAGALRAVGHLADGTIVVPFDHPKRDPGHTVYLSDGGYDATEPPDTTIIWSPDLGKNVVATLVGQTETMNLWSVDVTVPRFRTAPAEEEGTDYTIGAHNKLLTGAAITESGDNGIDEFAVPKEGEVSLYGPVFDGTWRFITFHDAEDTQVPDGESEIDTPAGPFAILDRNAAWAIPPDVKGAVQLAEQYG